MEFEIGIVCGRCDRYSPMGTETCVCGNDLTLFKAPAGTATSAPPVTTTADRLAAGTSQSRAVAITGPSKSEEVVPSGSAAVSSRTEKSRYAHLSQEELMEQARNYVCLSCSAPVPLGHKFCGRCGTGVPPEILDARTLFFSDMQNPSKAKLVLIRGEGAEGLSYHLRADEHLAGKSGNLQFPDDPFISERHANFFYRDDKLVVRDEGSMNGVYIRIRGGVEVALNDTFLAGEQVFRIEANNVTNDPPAADGTYFYASPKHPGPFRIMQIFQGGVGGMTVCARSSSLQIGREGGDLNFPGDPYMSGTHCRLEENNGKLTLTDLNSRNGTYVRIKGERDLEHGDYLFLGRKLLRVEMNTN